MTSPRTRRLAATAMVALLAGLLAGSCGDDDDAPAASGDATTTSETTSEVTEVTEAGEIELTGAWARTSPAVATAGAAYVEITNGTDTDDVLVAASVDPAVAARVELHETVTEAPADDGAMGGDMGTGGSTTMPAGAPMMQMRPVDEIPVAAGETVRLEPGGLHIMLLDLAAPLEVGTDVELTLTFAEAGDLEVVAEVRDVAP